MPTLSYITQLGTDFQLKQFNGQIYRRLEADRATSWSKIRIGIRFSVSPLYIVAASISGTPRLYLGMCNFDKGGPATMSQVAHFVGIRNAGSVPTINGGGTSCSFSMTATKRVNSIFTEGSNLGGTYRMGDGSILCMAAVEIDKTTPGSTVISHFRPSNSVTGIFNVTQDSFLEQMENSTPSLTGYTYSASTTLSVDEATNGVLDAVCLAWDRTSIPLWIADICWSQLP
jgi:hypothetical protein